MHSICALMPSDVLESSKRFSEAEFNSIDELQAHIRPTASAFHAAIAP
jgi:hypothetical protein